MVENGGRDLRRPQMRQWVDVEVHGQVHFAVRALDVGGQELGLEVYQLLVRLDFARRDLEAVQVGHVAIAVDVARLPDVLAVRIDEGDVHPQLRLRAQRAGRQVVAGIEIFDVVGERQILADLRFALDVGTVDLAAVLHDLPPELVALAELGEVLVDDLPRIFTVEGIGPTLGNVDLDLSVCDLVVEVVAAPALAPIELQPFLDAKGLGFGVVRKDAGVGDRIARPDEAMIGMLASRVDLLAADDSGGRGRVALGLAGDLAHVAVLTGDARFACRTVAILIPHDLKLDA